MNRNERLFGTLSMAAETAAFVFYVIYFIVARLQMIASISLPLPKPLVRYTLMAMFLSTVLGIVGLIGDRRRLRAIVTLLLILPVLMVMGILNGNW